MGRVGVRVVAVLLGALLVGGCASSTDTSTESGEPATATSEATSSERSAADEPAAGYARIPGTRISLRVPDGMEVDGSLPGLGRPNSRTSVLVIDQEQTSPDSPEQIITELESSFSDPVRAAREGLTLGPPRRTEVAGFPAVITSGTQSQQGATFRKAIVALAPPNSFVTLTGTIEDNDPITTEQLLEVLEQARWSDERAESGLGIEVTPAADYQQVPSSGSVLYSLGGRTGPDVAVFIASPSLATSAVPVEGRRDFAEQRYAKLPGNPSPESVTETSIAGLPAWEILGGSTADVVYAAMVFTDDGYVLLTGVQPRSQPDQIEAFRAMARSLTLSS